MILSFFYLDVITGARCEVGEEYYCTDFSCPETSYIRRLYGWWSEEKQLVVESLPLKRISWGEENH